VQRGELGTRIIEPTKAAKPALSRLIADTQTVISAAKPSDARRRNSRKLKTISAADQSSSGSEKNALKFLRARRVCVCCFVSRASLLLALEQREKKKI
jgi:predicted ABC-class ATPase